MSSADEGGAPLSKKRKIQRACDYCRRKKIKCDGPLMPDNRCSKCLSRRSECTYLESLHRSGYPSSYVENLESRLERMEKLIDKLCPEGHPNRDRSDDLTTLDQSKQGSSHRELANSLSPLAVTPQTPAGSDDFDPSDDEASQENTFLMEDFQKLSLDPQPPRYHGKSSGWTFIRSALDQCPPDQTKQEITSDRRQPWLRFIVEREIPLFDHFPPRDLMDILVELYFRKINDDMPLLHEPTFKKAIELGMHLRHGGFGATVLLVCANGSRFTRDPRVLLDVSDEQSAGWQWFQHTQNARKPPLAPAQLYDLQIYVLMIIFLQGTSTPHVTWTLIGAGIRAAVDVGAHRRKKYSTHPTPEEELWRRAFWILVILEWKTSYGLGRPASIHDEDIDVSLPTEVDDEYWTDANGQALFKQPPGKPSKVTSFNYHIRLAQILAFASRTLYSINKSRMQLGHGNQQWEQHIVTELDSALNKWLTSLPSHLHWDPDQPNTFLLKQAATLFAYYSVVQITVHRMFISFPRRDAPSFPSLTICTNAARSSIKVLETLCQRTGTPSYHNVGILLMSGIVLMMNVWAERRSGRNASAEKDLAYVHKCKDMLKLMRYEQHTSVKLWEFLDRLTTAANSAANSHEAAQHEAHSRATGHASSSTSSNPAHTTRYSRTTPSNQGDSEDRSLPIFSFSGIASAQPTMNVEPLFRYSNDNTQHQDQLQSHPILPPMRTDPTEKPPTFIFTSDFDGPAGALSSFHQAAPQVQPRPQADIPPQPGTGSASQNEPLEQSNFDEGMAMFGLEPLGYSEAVSLHPSANLGQTDGENHAQAPQDLAPGMAFQGNRDEGMGFAFLDDALTMWSNAPSCFGWDDWGTYLNDMNVAQVGNTNDDGP